MAKNKYADKRTMEYRKGRVAVKAILTTVLRENDYIIEEERRNYKENNGKYSYIRQEIASERYTLAKQALDWWKANITPELL